MNTYETARENGQNNALCIFYLREVENHDVFEILVEVISFNLFKLFKMKKKTVLMKVGK